MNLNAGTDPYVVIRYGGVSNEPALPVLDLQFLEGYAFDANMLRAAQEALRHARALGLTDIVREIESFLNQHQATGRRKR